MNRRLHGFKFGTHCIVVDVYSGAIHTVTAELYDVMMEYNGYNKEEICRVYQKTIGKEQLDKFLLELDQLIIQKTYLVDEEYLSNYKNNAQTLPNVKAMCMIMAQGCNLSCKYCFADEGKFGRSEALLMEKDIAQQAVDFLVLNSQGKTHCEIDFFGGEPLLNKDVLYSTIKYIRDNEKKWNKEFQLTITTNATLIDDYFINFVQENNIFVILSLDGRKDIHDLMRPKVSGEGSFNDAFNNIKKLIKANPSLLYYVRGTYTAYNLDFLEDAKFLWDNGLEKISLEPVVGSNSDYILREEHMNYLLEQYDELSVEYMKRKSQNANLEFFHFNLDLYNGPCLNKRLKGCGAAGEYVAVDTNGDLFPCHQFVGKDEFKLGSIKDGFAPSSKFLQEKIYFKNILNKDECLKCWAKYYCGGGCHANAFLMNGNFDKPYKIGCELQKKRIECAIGLAIAEESRLV